ncbi:branched-chain amino acid ABC transporter permease [Neobacillus sp. 114]|uniref:branched-chain amino acid ABC transporter permease n=1 Tax=Neobacillus sp. 114 TaxID=3048535 RepID=UPI0024C2EFC8|nr:branched-chain amino acid ABC transporter permease [Neobacillus sp. 114]
MDSIIQLIVNSLQTGAIYVIFALGLTLVFGVMKIVNFAHGEFYTAGAFLTYLFIDQWGILTEINIYLAYLIAFICSIVIVGMVGYFIEMTIFSRFHGDMVSGLIISLGLSMVLQVLYLILFSANPKNITSIFKGTNTLFGGVISNERIAIFILALLFTVGMALIIKQTKFGKAMRAISQDKEAAELQGINYKSITRWGFVVGVILAASAGVLVSPASIVDPYIGGAYLMKAFIIIILGGMGSIPGCILAGFILGVIESFGTFYFNLAFATTLSFILVMVMLLIRPQGLMGNVSK